MIQTSKTSLTFIKITNSMQWLIKMMFSLTIGEYIAKHLQNVTKIDKPNPYVRWVDRWEPISEEWKPIHDKSIKNSMQNSSVSRPILVYNKVPRVSIYFLCN